MNAGRSGMTGDCHVPICEGLGVKFPRATRPYRHFLRPKDSCVFLAYLQFGYISDTLIGSWVIFGFLAREMNY